MKEQKSIPTGKVQRAGKFLRTGAKVGGNYIKHYAKKAFNPDLDRQELDQNNADDIYDALSTLKGSALKVAQMMSMDKNMLPTAYTDKFALAQYSAPPLSLPLVVKTFKKTFGKGPEALFETFSAKAINAASIGQVHQATLNGKKLAVKIQYPGVAESVKSDLRIVKPIAMRMFNITDTELNHYMGEVETKLLEETDYALELQRSRHISQACRHLPNLFFPDYYPELCGPRILTMDWVDGTHLKDWLDANPSQEERNKIGQALWDFYNFQVHELLMVHADPHPGNFIITNQNQLGVIDFGCVKELPQDFYTDYFTLLTPGLLDSSSPEELEALFYKLDFLNTADTPQEKAMFTAVFKEMITLLGAPFAGNTFDFGNDVYFETIYQTGERISNDKAFRKSKSARGSHHGLYINRTYFGLYSLLNQLKANITITRPDWLQPKAVA